MLRGLIVHALLDCIDANLDIDGSAKCPANSLKRCSKLLQKRLLRVLFRKISQFHVRQHQQCSRALRQADNTFATQRESKSSRSAEVDLRGTCNLSFDFTTSTAASIPSICLDMSSSTSGSGEQPSSRPSSGFQDAPGSPGQQRPVSPYAVGWERISAAFRTATARVEPGQEVSTVSQQSGHFACSLHQICPHALTCAALRP